LFCIGGANNNRLNFGGDQDQIILQIAYYIKSFLFARWQH